MMQAVYRCQNCEADIIVDIDEPAPAPQEMLNVAYGTDLDMQMRSGARPYGPHQCDPGTLGVMQLVAIRT